MGPLARKSPPPPFPSPLSHFKQCSIQNTHTVYNSVQKAATLEKILFFMYNYCILHSTENLKHIFPEMKLGGLIPNFYIHVSGSDVYFPTIGLIWNLYFPVLRKRTLSSTAGVERRAGNCRQAVVHSSSLPSPRLLRLSREFTLMTNIQI